MHDTQQVLSDFLKRENQRDWWQMPKTLSESQLQTTFVWFYLQASSFLLFPTFKVYAGKKQQRDTELAKKPCGKGGVAPFHICEENDFPSCVRFCVFRGGSVQRNSEDL